jgi:hypothetical protein
MRIGEDAAPDAEHQPGNVTEPSLSEIAPPLIEVKGAPVLSSVLEYFRNHAAAHRVVEVARATIQICSSPLVPRDAIPVKILEGRERGTEAMLSEARSEESGGNGVGR